MVMGLLFIIDAWSKITQSVSITSAISAFGVLATAIIPLKKISLQVVILVPELILSMEQVTFMLITVLPGTELIMQILLVTQTVAEMRHSRKGEKQCRDYQYLRWQY